MEQKELIKHLKNGWLIERQHLWGGENVYYLKDPHNDEETKIDIRTAVKLIKTKQIGQITETYPTALFKWAG